LLAGTASGTDGTSGIQFTQLPKGKQLTIEDDLKRYREARATFASARASMVKRGSGPAEQGAIREFDAKVAELDEQIADTLENLARVGRSDSAKADVPRNDPARAWAKRAADAIWKANSFGGGEMRAITASSIDIPALVLPYVEAMERPVRVTDLLVDRQESPSNVFEFWQQTTRTNNAEFVADLATKPTSTFTVTPETGTLQVLAHLSEPVPNRLWQDYTELQNWLISEMYQGLLDALEAQVLNGDGTGINFLGILGQSGTTPISFTTDVPTTLRHARTTFQTSGVQPTAWVLNPADAAALDLLRESGTPDLFVLGGGYQNGPADSGNIFGDIPRLVSPRVSAGKAILADWSKVRLFTRGGIVTMADPFTGFATNTTLLRSEMRIGMGMLRPDAFAIISLS
jgi:HK97 family phage major capsid protein